MILYVNGDSHTAGAEAALPYGFAEDDPYLYPPPDRRPHPDNLAVSWGARLAQALDTEWVCDAETAASNERILRTTTDWILDNQDRWHETLMIIQWTTWEREEWWYRDVWYQVNASGIDQVPEALQDRYRRFILEVDWGQKQQYWHQRIWNLHQQLEKLQIRHVFFNGFGSFQELLTAPKKDWNTGFIDPYDDSGTYSAILKQQGFQPTEFLHFGADAHRFWAQFVLQYLQHHGLLGPK
jgi:hypothetical protein